jgi:hypothetical protein
VAAVAILIVVILVALGVHGCQVSARNSALKSYSGDVYTLIQKSDQTGTQLFAVLSSGASSSDASSIQEQVNSALKSAQTQLAQAHSISVPDQVKTANDKFVLSMQMRADGIQGIANEIQPALGTSTSKDAVFSIAGQIAQLYSSDVVYKNYAAKELAGALHSAGIAVGAPNGVAISSAQFVPNVEWVQPTFVAGELHVSLPGSTGGKVAPGLHGHSLDSVSVDGTTLQTGSPNTIPASPAPSFTLNFTNGGTNNETNVVCKVTVQGTSDTGTTTVPETVAGHHATCKVTLGSTPPTGTQTVIAQIEKVPGEKNLTNNDLSFPVTFQ